MKRIGAVLFLCSFSLSAADSDNSTCLRHSEGLIDSTHAFISNYLCQPSVWFDSFFQDEQADRDSEAGTIARWYNDFNLNQHDSYSFETKLKLRLNLPKVSKRLKLVFESDDEDDVRDIIPKESEQAEESIGLRYDWIQKKRSSFNIKVSARPSIAARYRYTYPVTDTFNIRLAQIIYQKESVLGEQTSIDFDYAFHPEYLFRWANSAAYEDDINGWHFNTDLILYQHISDSQAINYRYYIDATNRPNHYISDTGFATTYRHNIGFKWFFYEITPRYRWVKEENEQRKGQAEITLRLEVVFNNI